jgi:hypothetical protein
MIINYSCCIKLVHLIICRVIRSKVHIFSHINSIIFCSVRVTVTRMLRPRIILRHICNNLFIKIIVVSFVCFLCCLYSLRSFDVELHVISRSDRGFSRETVTSHVT